MSQIGEKNKNTILSSSVDEFGLKCLFLCDIQVFQCVTHAFGFHKEPKIQVMVEIGLGRTY